MHPSTLFNFKDSKKRLFLFQSTDLKSSKNSLGRLIDFPTNYPGVNKMIVLLKKKTFKFRVCTLLSFSIKDASYFGCIFYVGLYKDVRGSSDQRELKNYFFYYVMFMEKKYLADQF